MDARSVSAPNPAPSWKLGGDAAARTQGMVVTGFGDLPTGRALFLQFNWETGNAPKGFLGRLLAEAPVTSAVPPDKSEPAAQTRAASIAFSGTGLRRIGLSEQALASFSRPFHEGMLQEDRLRRLGDRREGQWLPSVVAGGPIWSANTPPRAPAPSAMSAFDVKPVGADEVGVTTDLTVHALLLLYAQNDADAVDWAATVQGKLAADGVSVVRTLDLVLDVEKIGNFSREHFGFADALSQPLPYDDVKSGQASAVLVNGQAATKDPVQGVPLGEFLIGYVDGHHEKAPGPVVEDDAAVHVAGLSPSDDAEGFFDLGQNGSYLVARELKQDVAAFWRSMEECAALMRARDPENSAEVTGDWLAARVVGRDKDGHMLCPANKVLPSCADGSPDSSFGYFDRDAQGVGCPPGAHVRRAFPRDALAPTAAMKLTLLQAANNHRILRRGRKFGPKLEDPRQDDGVDRGLLFLCLNTDIERQFEFVQQTWLLNPSFATLFEEVDPLIGPAGRMTIRDGALRRIASVDTFVRLVGGDYFFLPSLPALAYLAAL
jgi:deferrochelatase/peroxidase EfeB